MAARPSSYLQWVPDGNPAYITQPSVGQSTTGWVFKEAPPFEYMNWLFYTLDQWIQYLDVQTPQVVTITHSNSPYVPPMTSTVIDCDTSGGVIVINLPDPSLCKGETFRVIHRTTDTNSITVNRAEGISDATSQVINTPWSVMTIVSIGTRYILV